MSLLLLSSLAGPALAQEAHCELRSEDYTEIRKTLRTLRRAQGSAVVVAGDGAACVDALDAILRNDPTLNVHLIDAPAGDTVTHLHEQLGHQGGGCGAVLRPSDAGWSLVQVGQCEEPQPLQPRMLTVTYWEPRGLSFRWNENILPGAGLSILLDGAYQIDETMLGEFGPSWRVLTGFDLSQGPLAGPYVGARGGVRHATFSGDEDLDAIVQMVTGRKWVAGTTAIQLGGGVLVRVPMGEGIQDETILPSLELRFGVAPTRR